ncbi:SDR family NAD(P)-dependent oxidoreductase [Colwelliaceae bacterium 6441]
MNSKNVLITGATSGIGLALCHKYTAKGDKVIACGRNTDLLAKMDSQVAQTCLFDVNNKEQIASAADEVHSLDILILNAGDCRYIEDVNRFDGQLFSDIITSNLAALGNQLQYFLPKVKAGGQVVFISSSATIIPFPKSEAYGASKAGVDYLANSLRLDLLAKNIGVTLVHPGFVRTPLTDKNNFAMPFLISSEQAASKIVSGVEARKSYLQFPKRLTYILRLFSFLPAVIWQKIIIRKQQA